MLSYTNNNKPTTIMNNNNKLPIMSSSSTTTITNNKYNLTAAFTLFLIACGFVFVSLRRNNNNNLRNELAGNGNDILSSTVDLVIVPGHAIYLGGKSDHSNSNNDVNQVSNWLASDFIKPLVSRLPLHIARGTSIPCKLLIFSGGSTSSETRLSEAQGYLNVAKTLELLPLTSKVALEEYSRDSFENLLNSLCVYRKEMGNYPQRVTVVGFDFKRKRFSQEHAKFLGIPQFTYVGMDIDLTPLYEPMEISTTIPQFQHTPFGCDNNKNNPLFIKRMRRDPYHRGHIPSEWCPEMKELFTYCPTTNNNNNNQPSAQKRPRFPWEV
jgi:hypothetical protein